MIRTIATPLPLLVLATAALAEPAADPHDDPRYQGWSKRVLAGKHRSVIRSIEKDLASPSPHRFAPSSWYFAHAKLGDLAEAASRANPAVRAALGPWLDILVDYDAGRYEEAGARWDRLDEDAKYPSDPYLRAVLVLLLSDKLGRWRETVEATRRVRQGLLVLWALDRPSDAYQRAATEAVLDSEPLWAAGSPEGDYVRAQARRPFTSYDERLATERYVELRPRDPHAPRLLAWRLVSDERFAEAEARARSSLDRVPLYWNSNHAEQYLRAAARATPEDPARLDRLSASLAKLLFPTDPAPRARALLAGAYVRDEDWGRARAILTEALKTWPEHPALVRKMASVEIHSERGGEAVFLLEPLVEANPRDPELIEALLEAQNAAGKPARTIELWERFGAELPLRSGLVYEMKVAFEKADRRDDGLALLARYLEANPDSYLRYHYASLLHAAGRGEAAVRELKRYLTRYPLYETAIAQLGQWVGALDGKDEAKAALLAHRDAFPWSPAAWKVLESYVEDADALYEEAFERLPDRAFPVFRQYDRLSTAERLGEMKSLLEAHRSRIEARGTPSEIRDLRQKTQFWFKRRSSRHRLTEAQLTEWGAELEALEALDYPTGYVSLYRAQLSAARGDYDAANEHMKAALRNHPEWYWTCFNTSVGRKMTAGTKFGAVYRAWKRDPYSAERNRDFHQIHIRWGGSKAASLAINAWAREHAPRLRNTYFEAEASSHFGDARSLFRRRYQRSSSIGSSLRYQDWFEASKRAARGPQSRVELTQSKDGLAQVRIVRPDGTVEVREDSIALGLPVYRERDRAWVRFDYDERGKFIGARASDGRRLQLHYDDAEQIVRFEAGKHVTLRFEYTEKGKLSRVELDGSGALVITYDETGDMEVEAEEGGETEVPLAVMRAFSQLREVIAAASSSRGLEAFAEDAPEDPRLEPLVRSWKTSSGAAEWRAGVRLARYLIDHLEGDLGRGRQAGQMLAELTERAGSVEERRELVGLLASFHARARPEGVTEEEYRRWFDQRRALTQIGTPVARQVASRMDRTAPKLLAEARWLPRSYLDIDGYYLPFREEVARLLPGMLPTAALIREGGDVVVGTEGGLSIYRRGHWQRFTFDEGRDRLNRSGVDASATSRVTGLAETRTGSLLVATEGGLVVLPPGAGYDEKLQSFRSRADGLPEGVIGFTGVAVAADRVFLGTESGLLEMTAEGRFVSSGGPTGRIESISSNGSFVVVRARGSLQLGKIRPEGITWTKVRGRVEHAIATPQGVVWVERGRVFGRTYAEPEIRLLPGQQDILKNDTIHGLGIVPLDDGSRVPAVLTDRGFSVYARHHFEHVKVPGFGEEVGVTHLAPGTERVVAITTSGPTLIEPFRARTHEKTGVVHDLLELPEHDLVLVAAEAGLFAIFGDRADEGPLRLGGYTVRRLARDPDGGVVLHDGRQVLRVDLVGGLEGLSDPLPLFEAESFEVEGFRNHDEVTSLAVASDRTVWMTTRSTLFRWRAGQLTRYSQFHDPEVFPALSHYLSRVVETVDGRIWVVASAEGHIAHQGVYMKGGLLELRGDRFVRLSKGDAPVWYITGYTPIGESEAIVGSNGGFGLHAHDRLTPVERVGSLSYKALASADPRLWLGTRGTRLAQDVWLFGSASGFVIRAAGEWIRPERLNWMLPRPEFAQYGARHVRAVAVGANGRVYAGTDFGLFEYDTGGAEALELLLAYGQRNARPDLLLDEERRRYEEDVRALLDAVPEGSAGGRMLREYLAAKGEVEQFGPAALVDRPRDDRPESEGSGEAKARRIRNEAYKDRLREQQEKMNALFLRLKREHPNLHRLLSLQPEELESLREKLSEGQLALQYLPTKRHLYVNIVRRDSARVLKVQVDAKTLYERASRASALLQAQAQARAVKRADAKEPETRDLEVLREDLHWLHQVLLDPVLPEVRAASEVLVAGVGPLSYIPFGALVEEPGERPRFAVERTQFASLPNLFMLQGAFGRPEPTGSLERSLVVGDPDETLPGARREAEEVARILDSGDPWLGARATRAEVEQAAQRSRVLHFATHGVLDPLPERTHLVLGSGQRLDIPRIMTLDLSAASVVTLSACETARAAGTGREYSTIAQAFALAGAPAIVATLWKVPDHASSELMVRFYRELKKTDGAGRLKALTQAQRRMLQSEDRRLSHPSAWAGYVLLGKP